MATKTARGKEADRGYSAFFWSAAILWAVLAFVFLVPSVSPFFHAAVDMLTEGNSAIKEILFVAFLAFGLTLRPFLPSLGISRRLPKNSLEVFLALVVVSMTYGVLLQMFFQGYTGSDANSFISHVSKCGGIECWEGTYLQHNHVVKSSVYFVQKYAGISVGPQFDNGEPIYQVFPAADAFGLLTIILSGLILLFGFISAMRQEDALDCVLALGATGLFLIASIDGGIFSQTGINACVVAGIFILRKRSAPAEYKFLLPLSVAAFIGFLPNLVYGTYIVFRDWFVAAVAVCAIFAFVDAESGWKKIAFLAVLVFSLMFFAAQAFNVIAGPMTSIPRASALGPRLPTSPNLVIYGLPQNASIADVEALLPEMNFSQAAKFGWYFVGAANSSSPINITTTQVTERLAAEYPGGYLYASMNRNGLAEQTVEIFWIRKPQDMDYSGLFSFKVKTAVDGNSTTTLTGVSTASGPMLGLEVGSYIQSRGGDAVVITLVV